MVDRSFEQLFALTSDAAFVERDGVLVAVNQPAADLYGIPIDELIGLRVVDLVPTDHRDFIEERTRRVREGSDRTRYVDQHILRPDGSIVEVTVRTAPIAFDGANARLALLRESRSTAEASPPEAARNRQAIFTDVSLDIATAPADELDATIEQLLEAIARTEGAERAYVIMFEEDGAHFSCTHEWCAEGVEPQIDYVQRLATDEFPWSVGELRENRVVHLPELSAVPVEATAERESFTQFGVRSILQVPMPFAGSVVGLVGFNSLERGVSWTDESIEIVRRVGEAIATAILRRDALGSIEQGRLAAEEANAAKTTFLSRMSHELRTPLNAVLGFTELLLLDEDRVDTDKAALGQVLESGQHLLALVEDVLDISRIESGGLSLSMEQVDVTVVVDAVVAMTMAADHAEGVDIHVDIKPGLLPVRADRQRLQQVLLNLTSNACKYNRPGGSVTIDAKRIGDEVVITVADTGIGIAEDALPRVFEPFDRLGHEHSDIEGVGVGLALTRMIVNLMGGEISIESTLGVGTTASVRLSAAEVSDGSVSKGDRPSSGDTRLVLGLEDNEASALLLRRIVEHEPDLRFVGSTTIADALELAAAESPDLILLDWHLADGDGAEFLSRFRTDSHNRSIPVVVVTADAGTDVMQRVIAAGAVDYLPKPVSVDRLRSTIRRFLPQP